MFGLPYRQIGIMYAGMERNSVCARARARLFIMRVQGQSNIFLNTILIDSWYSDGGA